MRTAAERLAKVRVTWGTPALALALSLIQLLEKIILEAHENEYGQNS
jgi:hypothetical protein